MPITQVASEAEIIPLFGHVIVRELERQGSRREGEILSIGAAIPNLVDADRRYLVGKRLFYVECDDAFDFGNDLWSIPVACIAAVFVA